jgi:hypothetical protein
VQCDILSKDGASHMNARATLSNGRTVKEHGGETVCIDSAYEESGYSLWNVEGLLREEVTAGWAMYCYQSIPVLCF